MKINPREFQMSIFNSVFGFYEAITIVFNISSGFFAISTPSPLKMGSNLGNISKIAILPKLLLMNC